MKINAILCVAVITFISVISWITYKYKKNKVDKLIIQYIQMKNDCYPKKDKEQLENKIRKQEFDISAYKFGAFAFFILALFTLYLGLKR